MIKQFEQDNKEVMSSKDIGSAIFAQILREGFWYKKDGKILFEDSAVFIGDGECDCMLKTHYVGIAELNGKKTFLGWHYWDWNSEFDVYRFSDYGKTWSVNKEDLEDK